MALLQNIAPLIPDNAAKFLQQLSAWQGIASPQELGPQTSQSENSARQLCKRRGLVTYRDGYWRLTDSGRDAVRGMK